MNNNQKIPLGLILLIIVSIIIAGIIAYATDSTIFGVAIGGSFSVALPAVINFLRPYLQKGNKKKILIGSSAIIGATLLITLILVIANASLPTLSTDKAEVLIAPQLQPYADELAQELGLPSLTVSKVKMDRDCYYRKPSLFKNGYISIEIKTIYLQADTFPEFEEGACNKEICYKYYNAPAEVFEKVDDPDIVLDHHKVNLYPFYTDYIFVDGEGNEYEAQYDTLKKNGATVFGDIYIPSGTDSNTSSGKKCPNCNGTGTVRYYYGDSDLQAILDGYDPYTFGKCSMCKGTGRT